LGHEPFNLEVSMDVGRHNILFRSNPQPDAMQNFAAHQQALCPDSQIRMTRSQSGQIQVGPLLIPHLFSSKHSGQI